MRLSRIHTPEALAPDTCVQLPQRAGHYLARVLRLKAGHPLVLFNGDGFDYAAEITSVRGDVLEVAVTARLPAVPESPLDLTLVQAISRGDRMDQCLQKATELGVRAVQLLNSERVEVRLGGARLEKRFQHWQGVIVAACEQSGRAVIPKLLAPMSIAAWLAAPVPVSANSAQPALRLWLDPNGEQALTDVPIKGGALQLAVGPEGGFSETENLAMHNAGLTAVHLGPRVLRTETAGPAAIAVLQALAGDFTLPLEQG